MAGELELIEVSVLTGTSDRQALTFTPGTPANPVAVGTAAQWRMTADGVAPTHVYIVFDGRSVHVAAAAPNLPVLLAGSPVGTNWVPAQVPCELRFGGACLIMRYAPRGGAFDQEERTVHDGGALWQAAQRAVLAAQANPQGVPPDAGEAQGSSLGSQYPAARPAAGAPARMDLGATTPLANAQPFREAAAKMASSPPGAGDLSPNTVRAPLVGGPPNVSPLTGTLVAPSPLAAKGSVPPGAAPRTASVPPGAEASAPPGDGRPLKLTAAKAPAPATPPAGAPPKEDEKKGYWASASAVKKATLLLMPFALFASYFMLQPEEAAPPPKVLTTKHAPKRPALALDGGTTADDAGTTGDAATAVAEPTTAIEAGTASDSVGQDGDAGELAQALDASSPKSDGDDKPEVAAKPARLAKGKKTPERLALDAVAAGSFADAAELYTALAAAHPDDDSYKQAARILRDKAGH